MEEAMAVNAHETFLKAEEQFAKRVADIIGYIEHDIDMQLARVAAPDLILAGVHVQMYFPLPDKDRRKLGSRGENLLVRQVADKVVSLYEKQCWTVCITDTPKSSAEPEGWTQKLFFKYTPPKEGLTQAATL